MSFENALNMTVQCAVWLLTEASTTEPLVLITSIQYNILIYT